MPLLSDHTMIQKASILHSNKFTYGPFIRNPRGRGRMFTVICPRHGEFTQAVAAHLVGKGCKKCAMEALQSKGRLTLESVQERTAGFGRDYTYSKLDYTTPTAPMITYACKTHGEIVQNVHNHLAGKGCPHCRSRKVNPTSGASRPNQGLTDENLGIKAAAIPDAFSFIRIERRNRRAFIVSSCDIHGEFCLPAHARLEGGKGCPACAANLRGQGFSVSFDEMVSKAREVHGDTYKYTGHRRENGKTWLGIECSVHGPFWQHAGGHLSGYGCIKCGNDLVSDSLAKPDSQWIQEAREVHGDLYQYKGVVRERLGQTRIVAVCQKHGEFTQRAGGHLNGTGCPSCAPLISKPNREISEFLTGLGVEHMMEAPIPGSLKKLDLYVPEVKLGIELNGIYWHSDEYKDRNYHADKQASAAEAGIRIVHIFDDEWSRKRAIVERALKNSLGLATENKISARSCSIGPVHTPDARVFMENNHIQGFVGATMYYGLFYSGALVALAGITMKEGGRGGKSSNTQAELVRYSTSASVRGGLSKLLKYAQTSMKFTRLTTFSDLRFFEGKSYAKVGFVEDGRIRPDYFYSKGGKRVHKCLLQKSRVKAMAAKGLALYDPTYTELKLSQLNGYSRVWDCGKIRWVKHWN